jgi:hypothetical protein
MPEPRPWERQEGERAKAFAAFECYRVLGPTRSLGAAWERYCLRPGGRRDREHADPDGDRGFPGYWGRWSARWRWQERALAWDAEQADIERDERLDRELQARAREHEEEMRQRQLMREEARAARAVARRVLLRTLQTVDAGQLDQMNVPDLLPYLQKAATLLEVGQKLERLCLGEATDVTRLETDLHDTVIKLADIMQEFCPPERWEELVERLRRLEDGH